MKDNQPDNEPRDQHYPKWANLLHYFALALIFILVFCITAGFYILRIASKTTSLEGGILAIALGIIFGVIAVRKTTKAIFFKKLHDNDHGGF